MSKLFLTDPQGVDTKIGVMLDKFKSKVNVYPPGTCPLTVQLSLLEASMNQTCGKCVPCRDGLPQLAGLLRTILEGDATEDTVDQMRKLATFIRDTADCAIGYQSAIEVLHGLDNFKREYDSHIKEHLCPENVGQKVPCINMCPAHVDIPAYIALVSEKDYAGAINMIRRDNPLPTACAMICEHPCEERCRRNLIDDSINIRGLKKYAVDQVRADKVSVPRANVPTGKKIAVIGGGPAGLTCAYFLALMGHKVVLYERHKALGGMLRYGIPNYRFPKDRLDEDLNAILSAGDIEVKYGVNVGKDVSVSDIRKEHDAIFVAIGAQNGKKLRIDGVDAGNVESAVEMLDKIGNGDIPDYTGKTVAIIGGGNVAMDAARSAVRCNAKDVRIVYRRRQNDMTALESEIESAVMEGIELMTLQAPKSIEKDENGNCAALFVQPQMIGQYDAAGRPSPIDANKEQVRIPCDVVLIAVGQDVVSKPFEEFGMPASRGIFTAGLDTAVEDLPGVFVGGDCATGPATAIRAIAAGKVAAHNIDEYLGYHHKLHCDVEIPQARDNNRTPTGRANITERPAYIRKHDFEHVENPLTFEEAMQEAGRCLRCDHFGCGVLKGGTDQ
ncbi:MAG: FAD-dependent oxidoreductase [Oscillospiraceae bacterium]|jgi:NADPH-dependent glutamate synthase beta subunit-like oxidoreductase|nr:FAD-dependent oxidoreductase [Oscillospiraceae bacterium]